jgi:PAS domain-containing protein
MDEELEQFEGQLAALSEVIRGIRSGGAGHSPTLFAELESAHEELRVADEELRTQQEQLRSLNAALESRQWEHERFLALLPEAVICTDSAGSILRANTAAARLVNVPVTRLLRRPIQTLVAVEDRVGLRRALSASLAEHGTFRCAVRLRPRGRPALHAELVAAVSQDQDAGDAEITWLLRRHAGTGPHHDTGGDPQALARALVRLTQLPGSGLDQQAMLSEAARICQQALGSGLEISVTIGPPVDPADVATTSELARRVDEAQMAAGQGPCQAAFDTGQTVITSDLTADRRWPRLAELLVEVLAGVSRTGAVALPLQMRGHLVGALNVYGSQHPERSLIHGLDLLAAAIAALLDEVALRQQAETTAANLRAALTSRSTIDQAKGIIMAIQGGTAEEAFARLVAQSSYSNTKLRDIATTIVEQGSPNPSPSPHGDQT